MTQRRSHFKLSFALMCFESSAYSLSDHGPYTYEKAPNLAISDGDDQEGGPQMESQRDGPCK